MKDLPYDPLKDFIPIIPLTKQPYVLVAGKTAGVATVGELIAAATAKPGGLNFGSTGVGTGTHIGVEKFNQAAGIKALHVPPLPSDSNADTIANAISGRFTYYNDIGRVLAGPDLRDWIARHGGEPMNMTQPDFERFVRSESESAARLILAAGPRNTGGR